MSARPDRSVTVSAGVPGRFTGQTPQPTVVWLTGEHDVSNVSLLRQIMAETIALDDKDVVVDLGGASFISGATIAIFMRANSFLEARTRSLVLRAPQSTAARHLALCGLAHLISPPSGHRVADPVASEALRTWVDVPPAERQPESPAPDVSAPDVPAPGTPETAPARATIRAGLQTASEVVLALDDSESRRPSGS